MTAAILLRAATSSDWEAIAALHAEASRVAYAGILDPHYLAVTIKVEKRQLWHDRLVSNVDTFGRKIVVADAGGMVAGFACLLVEHEPEWGVYLHNLYTDARWRGQGIARLTLAAAIRELSEIDLRRPLHLTALARNTPACAIYDKWGGRVVETQRQNFKGTRDVDVVRYQWPTCAQLLARLGA
jgi:GNAT superfamily N-acetyltransferase